MPEGEFGRTPEMNPYVGRGYPCRRAVVRLGTIVREDSRSRRQ